ncbi:probable 4-coumarate--CoA ligase 1 isoform X2 [Mytilus californianus]|uniref:probable 4-coumarate--CoA ligase 1 isoform X2 n=1 Tax=Mytilus californianus TaxID=6549 RepID=UPI0022467F44|nr:probable 4-coumarate--CoA ligase 1 isoform X2 [Mytilus californianus]
MAAIQRSVRIFPASCTHLTRQLFPKPHHRNNLSQARSTCLRYSTDQRSVPPITNINGETIVRSPYPDLSIPQCSFAEYVFRQLDIFSDFALMVDNTSGRHFSGRQLKEYSIKVASALTKMGFKKGDRILIFCSNCPEYAIMFMACSAIGVIVSTANPVYTNAELARQISHSESSAIVTLPGLMQTAVQAVNSSKDIAEQVKLIISIGNSDGAIPFSLLMEDDGKAFPENTDINSKEDILVLPYSSGTTGLPKGVMLSHYNIIANIEQLIRGPMSHLTAGKDSLIGVLPFYHIYGMVVVQFGSICLGTKLVTIPKFEPEPFLGAIQQNKISYMHLVPPLALFMAKSPLVEKFDVSTVQNMVFGAAPLGAGLTQELIDRIGANVIQAYGLTETSPASHYDRDPPKIGTVGHLVPSTLGKVIDVQTGKTLGPGETGEVLLAGPQVMLGYLKNQSATDDMVKDGWLHSGDIGHFDEEGYFMITDRLKELIKYKGFQVAPAELEALICTHPAVADVAVIGIQAGEDVGEVPKAYVVPKPGITLTEEDITNFVDANVAPYKKLRGGVKLIDSIPKTASGKILRREVKNM